MNLEELEIIRKRIEEEYNNICYKIYNLDKKESIISANNMNNKFNRIFIFFMITWILTLFVLMSIDLKGIVIYAPIVSCLSIGIPAFVGILAEKSFVKKANLRERLKEFSNANKQQLIEEEINYVIEKQKLLNKNKVLDDVCGKIVKEKELLETILDKYDVIDKSGNMDSKFSFEKNIENINVELNKKQIELDIIVMKQVLKDKLSSKINIGTECVMPILAFFMLSNLPVILMSQIDYQICGSLLTFISSFLISGVSVSLYVFKAERDKKQIFQKFNKLLEEVSLSNEEVFDELFGYERDLDKLLEEISTLRINLEQSQIKLKSQTILVANTERSNRQSFNYYYEPRNYQLSDDDLYQQLKSKDTERYLIKKRVKGDNSFEIRSNT